VRTSHTLVASCSRIAVVLLLVLFVIAVHDRACAQQPSPDQTGDRDRGIQLYQKGDARGAIEALRAATSKHKDDGDAWYYLGLALVVGGKKDEARDAFERAATIRLGDLITLAPLRVLDSTGPRPADAETGDRYQAAIDSVERYLQVTQNPTAEWPVQLEALRFYRNYYAGSPVPETIVSTREATTKLHILSKPAPDFSHTVASGNAILRAVLSADGSVKHILVLKRVASDFDRACIEAARKIKFTPAIKDGRATSMILQLEYNRYFL
jgi:TonB family protein